MFNCTVDFYLVDSKKRLVYIIHRLINYHYFKKKNQCSGTIQRDGIPKELRTWLWCQTGWCNHDTITPVIHYVNLCKVTSPFQALVSSCYNRNQNKIYLVGLLENLISIYPQPSTWHRVDAQNMDYYYVHCQNSGHRHTLSLSPEVERKRNCLLYVALMKSVYKS